MIHNILTDSGLSFLFKIAIRINVIALFSNVIIYRYFPNQQHLDDIIDNFSNLSLFITCAIIIYKILYIFIKKNRALVTKHKLVSLTVGICISVFCLWLWSIDNVLEEQLIILLSQASRTNNANVLYMLITLLVLLIVDFYDSLTMRDDAISSKTIPLIFFQTIKIVLRKHLFIFIILLGIFHFEKMDHFGKILLKHSKSMLFLNLTLLGLILPIAWVLAIGYYTYALIYKNDKS